jgi:hypothetical protein
MLAERDGEDIDGQAGVSKPADIDSGSRARHIAWDFVGEGWKKVMQVGRVSSWLRVMGISRNGKQKSAKRDSKGDCASGAGALRRREGSSPSAEDASSHRHVSPSLSSHLQTLARVDLLSNNSKIKRFWSSASRMDGCPRPREAVPPAKRKNKKAGDSNRDDQQNWQNPLA